MQVCCKEDDRGFYRAIIYCCNCLAVLALLGLIIAGSILAFWPKETTNVDPDLSGPECQLLDTPIATVALAYAFVISTCCYWVVCCCVVVKGSHSNGQYEEV